MAKRAGCHPSRCIILIHRELPSLHYEEIIVKREEVAMMQTSPRVCKQRRRISCRTPRSRSGKEMAPRKEGSGYLPRSRGASTVSPVFKETVFKEVGLLLRRRLSISNVSLSSNENYSYLDPTDF